MEANFIAQIMHEYIFFRHHRLYIQVFKIVCKIAFKFYTFPVYMYVYASVLCFGIQELGRPICSGVTHALECDCEETGRVQLQHVLKSTCLGGIYPRVYAHAEAHFHEHKYVSGNVNPQSNLDHLVYTHIGL